MWKRWLLKEIWKRIVFTVLSFTNFVSFQTDITMETSMNLWPWPLEDGLEIPHHLDLGSHSEGQDRLFPGWCDCDSWGRLSVPSWRVSILGCVQNIQGEINYNTTLKIWLLWVFSLFFYQIWSAIPFWYYQGSTVLVCHVKSFRSTKTPIYKVFVKIVWNLPSVVNVYSVTFGVHSIYWTLAYIFHYLYRSLHWHVNYKKYNKKGTWKL